MKKILLINANYYKDITDELEKAAYQTLKKKKFKISSTTAPGVFEIPFLIKKKYKKI